MTYKLKYLQYKLKYILAKHLSGGSSKPHKNFQLIENSPIPLNKPLNSSNLSDDNCNDLPDGWKEPDKDSEFIENIHRQINNRIPFEQIPQEQKIYRFKQNREIIGEINAYIRQGISYDIHNRLCQILSMLAIEQNTLAEEDESCTYDLDEAEPTSLERESPPLLAELPPTPPLSRESPPILAELPPTPSIEKIPLTEAEKHSLSLKSLLKVDTKKLQSEANVLSDASPPSIHLPDEHPPSIHLPDDKNQCNPCAIMGGNEKKYAVYRDTLVEVVQKHDDANPVYYTINLNGVEKQVDNLSELN